jgi:two-component system chemotaxis response regulator CheY
MSICGSGGRGGGGGAHLNPGGARLANPRCGRAGRSRMLAPIAQAPRTARDSEAMSIPFDTRVLVVDDFESMRRIVRQLLYDMGFRDITLADDGTTALAMLRQHDFGFLVTDWHMPRMDGIDLVRAVRADPRLKPIPILMVTAEAKREQIIEAVRAGVNDYVVKPFTPQLLKAKIEKLFEPPAAR